MLLRPTAYHDLVARERKNALAQGHEALLPPKIGRRTGTGAEGDQGPIRMGTMPAQPMAYSLSAWLRHMDQRHHTFEIRGDDDAVARDLANAKFSYLRISTILLLPLPLHRLETKKMPDAKRPQENPVFPDAARNRPGEIKIGSTIDSEPRERSP